jgi:hypothetical protein
VHIRENITFWLAKFLLPQLPSCGRFCVFLTLFWSFVRRLFWVIHFFVSTNSGRGFYGRNILYYRPPHTDGRTDGRSGGSILFLTIDIKSLAAHGPGCKRLYYMRLLFMIPPKNNRFRLFSWFILRNTSSRVVCCRRGYKPLRPK